MSWSAPYNPSAFFPEEAKLTSTLFSIGCVDYNGQIADKRRQVDGVNERL
ncbi:hypothetical protein CASFOL_005927 [Castilleja foliolosa]|uniref:Uncharacterized protein n=1 Tax=Castilleja foliolosa TaxID=1961234 RepID=A0ABD3E8T5_9LAMI